MSALRILAAGQSAAVFEYAAVQIPVERAEHFTEGSKERREQLQKQYIKAYLRKPVSPESLTEAVTSALKG